MPSQVKDFLSIILNILLISDPYFHFYQSNEDNQVDKAKG
jgi:hypothetical protein